MNVFLRELKANRKAILFWSIGMFLLVATGIAKYSGVATSRSIYEFINEYFT